MLKKSVSFSALFVLLLCFGTMRAQNKNMMKDTSKTANKYMAVLSGKNVIPPVKTQAKGTATFSFSKNGKILYYNVTVHNIKNVIMAHIHHAPKGKDGPIAVWLYKGQTKGTVNGVLSKGRITNKIINFDSLKTWINNGDAYVLIHTKAHPNGEIRGMIKPEK